MSYWIHLCRGKEYDHFYSYRSAFVPVVGDSISIKTYPFFPRRRVTNYLVKSRLIEFVEHSDKSSVVDVTLHVKDIPTEKEN